MTLSISIKRHYAECDNAEGSFAECRYTEFRSAVILKFFFREPLLIQGIYVRSTHRHLRI
jgi:hypothetical protein